MPDPESVASPADPAQPTITVARIAHLAGVSAPTVSKVLNGHSGVAQETRSRVEEIIRQVGYRRATPAPAAIVEVVFQALDSLWALDIVRGVEEAVRHKGLAVALTSTHGGLAPQPGWLTEVLNRRPAGIIAVSAHLGRRQRAQLASRAIPLITVDPSGEPVHDVPSVGTTNWSGGVLAARHLLELGHRRIAMINGPGDYLCCRARLDGFRAALERAGVTLDPALLRVGPLYAEAGYDLASDLLRLAEPPTAIFTANDLQALGTYEAARRHGRRIPEDLSVVGFDDLAVTRWASPPLTTVRQPLVEMGSTAGRMILDLAAGREPKTHRVELSTSLTVRHSTAPPRA